MSLDRSWIEEHIPHQGRMCLLDEVLEWDAKCAKCRSSSHRSLDNPLRAYGRLGASCGVEYAAQTMAVHGAAIAAAAGVHCPPGYLASVRGLQLHVDQLDDISADLIASVQHVAGNERTALYEFSVTDGQRILLSGRATIAFIT